MILIPLVLIAGFLIWMAQVPGLVEINWFDYSIILSTQWFLILLAGGVFVFCLLLSLKYRWRLMRAKRSFKRQEKRTIRTEGLILEGLAAIASRDVHRAKKALNKLRPEQRQSPLALILSAQTAMLAHEPQAAEDAFRKMADLPQTRLMGLRGLVMQQAGQGHMAAAHGLIEATLAQNPKSPWALETAFELEVRSRDWDKALPTLKKLARLQDMPDLKHKRALIYFEQAHLAQQENNGSKALKLSAQAYDLEKALAPLAVSYAHHLFTDKQARKARKILAQSWKSNPHPDLAVAYVTDLVDPLEQFSHMQTLHQMTPHSWVSRMMYSHYAVQAQMWGIARPHLEALVTEKPFQCVYADLIAMEDKLGNLSQMRALVAQAAHALPNPGWHCQACGHTNDVWSSLCSQCGDFDTLLWTDSHGHHVAHTADQQVLLPGE
jgi:HemY protein